MLDPSMEFLSLANQASNMFIKEGTSLNEAIAKIASARELSQMQIQRVVELANHETNERLMKQASDRTFRFDVASLDGVLSKLGVNQPETVKVASHQVATSMRKFINTDAHKETVVKLAEKVLDSAVMSDLRVKHAMNNMVKIGEYFVKHRRNVMSKLAGVREGIRQDLTGLTTYARNHVLNGGSVADLHKFACNYDRSSGHMWDVVFGSVLDGVRKSDPMLKTAKVKPIPKSDEVPYEVVNGNHKLCIALDTLKNKISEEDKLSYRLKLMDTHGPAVVVGIKSLKTCDDVQKHIAEDIEKIAFVCHDEDQFVEKLAGLISSVASGADRSRRLIDDVAGAPGRMATSAISAVSKGVGKIPFVGRPAELALDVASVPFRLASKPGSVLTLAALLGLFGAAKGAGQGVRDAFRPVVYKQ